MSHAHALVCPHAQGDKGGGSWRRGKQTALINSSSTRSYTTGGTDSTRSYTTTGTGSYTPSHGALEIFYAAQNSSRWGLLTLAPASPDTAWLLSCWCSHHCLGCG